MSSFKNMSVMLIVFILNGFAGAQNKQGNIVQYFGKEKVEEIKEGKLIHVFEEGLVTGTDQFQFEKRNIPTNHLFARILSDGKSGISEGRQEMMDLMGNKLIWEKLNVNEKNEFQDRKLSRDGYLIRIF